MDDNDLRVRFKNDPMFKLCLTALVDEEYITFDELKKLRPDIVENPSPKYDGRYVDIFDEKVMALLCPALLPHIYDDELIKKYRENEDWVVEIYFNGSWYQMIGNYDSWNGVYFYLAEAIPGAIKGKRVIKPVEVFEADE